MLKYFLLLAIYLYRYCYFNKTLILFHTENRISQLDPILYTFAMFPQTNISSNYLYTTCDWFAPKISCMSLHTLKTLDYLKKYKIHGLWPETTRTTLCSECNTLNIMMDSGQNISSTSIHNCFDCIGKNYITYCKKVVFDYMVLQRLMYFFDNYYKQKNLTLYYLIRHEYMKHGSCTNLEETDYFIKTQQVYNLVMDYQISNNIFCNNKCEFVVNQNTNRVILRNY